MSNQHRATPEQWAGQEHWATPPDPGQLLRQLLELRARVEALEAAASERRGKAAASTAALSLAERVQDAIDEARPDHDTAMARAAIRAVAAWLRSEYPQREGYGTAWANKLDEEATR